MCQSGCKKRRIVVQPSWLHVEGQPIPGRARRQCRLEDRTTSADTTAHGCFRHAVRVAGVLVAVLALASSASAATIESAGAIDAVTVYRGQALVTRLVEIPGPAGLHEVVVTDLPAQVVPGSIYAESADGVEVRSVRYRVRPVAQDVRAVVRKLDAEIAGKRDEIEGATRRRQLLHEHWEYLNRLDEFIAPTATVELTRGVLNAETLKALTLFVFEERRKLSEETLEIDRRKRALEGAVALLERQRNELTGGSARSVREAVVFVDLRAEQGGALRVRYLVENASWSPSYNVRSGDDRARVMLEYNAAIQQRSGEDWSDVAMTLSTATPTLVARAPKLEPLNVSLTSGDQQAGKLSYGQQMDALLHQKKRAESLRNAPMGKGPMPRQQQAVEIGELWTGANNQGNDRNLNALAARMQMLDLQASKRAQRAWRESMRRDEGVSVTYRIPGRTSLPSRSDRQSIQIAALQLPASFYKVGTPVLTEFVYDEAELSNTSQMVLLAGPVAAFSGGEFVGHGEIPTVAAGEQFEVGFGIDASLRATRELVDRTERISGGNRVVTFKYRLVVDNFGDAPAGLRLLDRLPQARGSQVQVTLAGNGHALCDDRAYTRGPRKDGILRWDAEIPAGANGLTAFAIDYEFQLEYDRAKSITGLATAK